MSISGHPAFTEVHQLTPYPSAKPLVKQLILRASVEEARMVCRCINPGKKLIRLYGREEQEADALDVLVEKVCRTCRETVALIRMKIDKSSLKRVIHKKTES